MAGMSLRLGPGLSRQGGSIPITSEALALYARMTTPPTELRKSQINALIYTLKTAGVWSKLDALYINAAADSQAALLNWVADQYNETAVASPTFTVDRGFTGDGVASYLDTGFDATVAVGAKYLRNDSHFAVWCGTNVNDGAAIDFGNSNVRICARSSGSAIVRANSPSNDVHTLPSSTSTGWLCVSRDNSANFRIAKNNSASTTISRTSSTLVAMPFYAGAIALTGPVGGNFSVRRQQAAHFGGGLTDAQMLATYNAIATYMTAVGA